MWTAEAELRHYNASVRVCAAQHDSEIVWIADLQLDNAAPKIEAMMDQRLAAMRSALGDLS
ncbi:MAG: hypothetical protein QM756_04870 [Polyangiaceae bacterium]